MKIDSKFQETILKELEGALVGPDGTIKGGPTKKQVDKVEDELQKDWVHTTRYEPVSEMHDRYYPNVEQWKSVNEEKLNKSDLVYQLGIDYSGNTKPKVVKLNKKELNIKYGYKVNPKDVIKSFNKLYPNKELKHVKWDSMMTGGGIHRFVIKESIITEYGVKDPSKPSKGDNFSIGLPNRGGVGQITDVDNKFVHTSHAVGRMKNGKHYRYKYKLPLKNFMKHFRLNLGKGSSQSWIQQTNTRFKPVPIEESVNEMKLKKKKSAELTYNQAMSTQKLDHAIKDHIKDNYPEDHNPGVSRWHGGGKVGMTGKQGHSLSTTHIMKIAKFAKKNKDSKLAKLIDKWVKVAKANDIIESVNEAELKLGIKYVNKKGDVGFIQTGGSKDPNDWIWYDGKNKHSYKKVKRDLKPAKDQKKTGLGDYLKQGGRMWDHVEINEAKDNLYLQLHKKYAEQIKGLKAKKIKKLTDLVSVQRWSMEDMRDYFDLDSKKKKELSAEYNNERKLFKKYMAGDHSVMLPKGTETLAESINEGKYGKELGKIFGNDFPFDYTEKGNKIVIEPEGYNDDGTLFNMKDDWKEKIIKTIRMKKKKWHASPNMGGGITIIAESQGEQTMDVITKKGLMELIKEEVQSLNELSGFPDMKRWWKEDPKDVMSFVYWLQGKIPPSGSAFDKAWKAIATQLNKKHKAPSSDFKKIMGESIVNEEKMHNDFIRPIEAGKILTQWYNGNKTSDETAKELLKLMKRIKASHPFADGAWKQQVSKLLKMKEPDGKRGSGSIFNWFTDIDTDYHEELPGYEKAYKIIRKELFESINEGSDYDKYALKMYGKKWNSLDRDKQSEVVDAVEGNYPLSKIKRVKESVNEAKKYDWDDILDVLTTSTAVGRAGRVIDMINPRDPEVKDLLKGRYKSFPDFAKAVKLMYNLEEMYDRFYPDIEQWEELLEAVPSVEDYHTKDKNDILFTIPGPHKKALATSRDIYQDAQGYGYIFDEFFDNDKGNESGKFLISFPASVNSLPSSKRNIIKLVGKRGNHVERPNWVNEAENYDTKEFKVGDKIKTNIGVWEVIETDYKPGKSFAAPFIFKGKDMKRVNIPNPPKTNKNAVGYKVTDGDKYPIIGFLYQYKDITKLATVGVDESVNEEPLNEAVGLGVFAAMMLAAGILGRLALMNDKQLQGVIDTTTGTGKGLKNMFKKGFGQLSRQLPIIGKKLKYKDLQKFQSEEVKKYLNDELTDKDIIDVLSKDPKLKEILDDVAAGGKQYSDLYRYILNLGGGRGPGYGQYYIHDKFKKLRKDLKAGNIKESVFLSFNSFVNETIGTINAPVYGEDSEQYPEINVESKDERYKKYLKEIASLLKEIYSTALDCECDGHKIKETLFPKYKDTKVKMQVTEEGIFRFDSFGKYPDVNVNLKNMKKGKHTKESLLKEVKNNIKKLEERMPGMPSQSAIASFSSAPHLTGAGAGMMPS